MNTGGVLRAVAAQAAGVASLSSPAATAPAPKADGKVSTSFEPDCVLVKIGGRQYLDTSVTWKQLADMRKGGLLGALRASASHGPSLKGVEPDTCSVHILKGELPPAKVLPDATDEAPEHMLVVAGAMTLQEAADAARCAGKRLFIVVSVPDPNAPKLPEPKLSLSFSSVVLAKKETWLQASFNDITGEHVTMYLTEVQHKELNRFIDEAPGRAPQVLLPVGPIKSGKSTLLQHVIPGMVGSKYHSGVRKGRRKPVFFYYSFPVGKNVSSAIFEFEKSLKRFGDGINIPYEMSNAKAPGEATADVALAVRDFASRIAGGGGELWLLLDELQAPILHDSPERGGNFIHFIKDVSRGARMEGALTEAA